MDQADERLDNRLVFPDKYLGREVETNTLIEVYQKVCRKQSHSNDTPLVLIGGYSGAGKSHLARHFAEKLNIEAKKDGSKIKPCYFLSGKYDENISADPFSAIVQAFSGFCQTLLDGDASELEKMRGIIQEAVGDEGKVVTDVVPNLLNIIGEQKKGTEASYSNKEFDWNRLLYVFKNFVDAISTTGRPLVLFLDDVQWMDEASLNLVFHLVNSQTDNLMIVASYRSNEVDAVHPLSIRVSNLETDFEKIELENLSLKVVGEFIAATLRLEVEEVAPLSKVVYGKTQGNIFFTKQCLEDLRRKQVLCKTMTTFQWTWNMVRIDVVAIMSDNVVDMVTSKITSLSTLLQMALASAAYLKTSFDPSALLSVMEAEGHSIEANSLHELLEEAVSEGLLLNSVKDGDYQFAHDRIKEASRELVPDGEERDAFLVRLAKHMIGLGKSSEGEDWMLFVAADHLSSVRKNDMTPLEIATLNAQVGAKAVATAAFFPALKYLERGMEALNQIESPWELHYDLALRLYRSAANVELCFGDFAKGEALCRVLIANATSTREKLRIKLNLAQALGQIERHKEAMDVHLDALYSINALPKRFHFVRALRELVMVKSLLKTYSDQEINALPPMADDNALSAMEHMMDLAQRCLFCGIMETLLLSILRLMLMTFKHGLCAESAQAFASYGMIVTGQGDIEMGRRMAKLAKQILEKVDQIDRVRAKKRESVILLVNANFIESYCIPIPHVLVSLRLAYKSGMEAGDLENVSANNYGATDLYSVRWNKCDLMRYILFLLMLQGYIAWALSNVLAYSAGFPLGLIATAGAKLVHQLKQYGVKSVIAMFEPAYFTYVQLMGTSQESFGWDNLDEMISVKKGNASHDETFRLAWWYWSRLQLAYYFGEFEIAGKMYYLELKSSAVDTSYIFTTIRVFFSGLAASGLYRKTGKRMYKRRAKMMIKEMEKVMSSKRGLNTLHRYLLMQADMMACSSSKRRKGHNTVKNAFDEAIVMAGKAGFRQDAALGNELAGEYSLTTREDNTFWAEFYFSRAYDLYMEWGAVAKADQLKTKRGDLIKESLGNRSASTNSSSLRCLASGDDSLIHNAVRLELLTRVDGSVCG
jgi:histidine kinase